MDPIAQIPVHDDTTIAMLFGVVMALIRLVEKGGTWLMNRKKSERPAVVQLDPAASEAIAEVLGRVKSVQDVVDRRDGDGVPLVYFSRKDQERMHDDLQEVRESVNVLVARSKSS